MTRPQEARAGLQSRWYRIDGHRVHARVDDSRADAPWTVLVHGWGASGRYLVPLARTLSRHHRVAVPDLPGHGRSPAIDGPSGVTELALWLGRWLDAAGITRPQLVAHSLGCQVALHMASHGDRIPGMVLVSPAVQDAGAGVMRQAGRLLRDASREPLSLVALLLADYVRTGLRQPLRAMRSAMVEDVQVVAARVHVPAVLLTGDRDVVVPRARVEQLAGWCRGEVRVVEVPGAAHGLPYTCPDRIAEVLPVTRRGV